MKKTAYCKINLTLEILGTKRADGFHDLKTIMHKIPLGDVVELDVYQGNGKIEFSCNNDLCSIEDNLAYRAAKSYLQQYKENTGKTADIVIKLEKITPSGAGLGGGSADAATVLDMLQQKLGSVSDDEIFKIASKLGSDVPFCLERHVSAYCTGRGEICRSITTLPKGTSIVVAKPVQSINTKGIYGEYDKTNGDDYTKSRSDEMEKALQKGNLLQIANNLVNDFEDICINRLTEIDNIKAEMLECGAVCSQMSGSGSAVFGLFDDANIAKKCRDCLLLKGLIEVYCFDGDDFEKMYMGE